MSKINSVDAFKMGMKPAFFTTTADSKVNQQLEALSGYPFLTEEAKIVSDENCYLFFQNGQAMNDFLDKTRGLSPESKEFNKILGLTLGYPPKSVEFFEKKWDDKSLTNHGVALTHAGSTAITHIDDLVEVANWFWNTYPLEEEFEMGLVDMSKGWVQLTSPYGDQSGLVELQKKGLEIIHRNTPAPVA